MEGGIHKRIQDRLNFSGIWNHTEDFYSSSERGFTNISFGIGCCITILNVSTMFFLFRHRNCVSGNGFWQQLVFLCSTDILSGVAIALPQFGYLFFAFHSVIYYFCCTIGLILLPLSNSLSFGNCFIISILRYMTLKYIDNPSTIWYKHATYLMFIGNVVVCVVTVSSSVLVVIFHFGFQTTEFCENLNLSGQDEYKFKYLSGSVIMLVLFLIGTNISTVLCMLKVKSINKVQLADSRSEANRNATVTFIIIVSALNLTSVPGIMFWTLTLHISANLSADATEIISRIISVNSLCNPFIYSLRSTPLRSAIWTDLSRVLSRIRCIRDRRIHSEI